MTKRENKKKTHLFSAHRPLDELDAGLQVQTEVNEVPLDALPLVLLLLQDEHGVVEQLLQALVGVVDAQLLKRVILQREKRKTSQCQLVNFVKVYSTTYSKKRFERHMSLNVILHVVFHIPTYLKF